MLDLFFLKVSDIANQVFTLAAFAHESFSNPSSNLPAYNNSAYQQQGKVRWDRHLKKGEATRWCRLWTWGLASRSTRWGRGLTVPVSSGTMTSRASMVGGESFPGYLGDRWICTGVCSDLCVNKLVLRTRERCDQLASQGFMVILPDYYHGAEDPKCSPTDFFCWFGQFSSLRNLQGVLNPVLPHRAKTFHCGKLKLDPTSVRLEPGEILGWRKWGHKVCCCGWVVCSTHGPMICVARHMLGILHDFEDVFLTWDPRRGMFSAKWISSWLFPHYRWLSTRPTPP